MNEASVIKRDHGTTPILQAPLLPVQSVGIHTDDQPLYTTRDLRGNDKLILTTYKSTTLEYPSGTGTLTLGRGPPAPYHTPVLGATISPSKSS